MCEVWFVFASAYVAGAMPKIKFSKVSVPKIKCPRCQAA